MDYNTDYFCAIQTIMVPYGLQYGLHVTILNAYVEYGRTSYHVEYHTDGLVCNMDSSGTIWIAIRTYCYGMWNTY